jgi:cell pole-organizing protein PopZ
LGFVNDVEEAVMNKPAPKEPSMDEILSSIRQIIADDDAAAVPKKPSPPPISAVDPVPVPRPAPPPVAPMPAPQMAEPEPLALTPAQMLREEPPAERPAAAISFSDILGGEEEASEETALSGAPLVDPEDITFENDDMAGGGSMFSVPVEEVEEPAPPPPPLAPAPAPAPIARMAPPPIPRAAPSVARAAPMPDPTLSRDMAEKLLEPTTDAVVKSNFAKLNGLSMVGSGVTLDALMRDMLRPMLKDWLDENLPALVERMVEKEIARISRGGE